MLENIKIINEKYLQRYFKKGDEYFEEDDYDKISKLSQKIFKEQKYNKLSFLIDEYIYIVILPFERKLKLINNTNNVQDQLFNFLVVKGCIEKSLGK